MNLGEAIAKIYESGELKLINEFMSRSLNLFELRRALKGIIPGFDYIRDSATEQHNDMLYCIKPEALERSGITLKQLENRIRPLGWTVSGYTENQIVLVPIHNGTRDSYGDDIRNVRKADRAAVVNALRGYYVRFSNIPPDVVKRIGFRTTKDRNMDFDNPKKSNIQYWNQERVYCYSLNALGKRCQGKIDYVINGIFVVVEAGYEYGRYMYLFKTKGERFNRDVEYGFGSLAGVAGFLEAKINPHEIILAVDTKTNANGADEIVKATGLDKMVKDGNYRKFLGREPEVNSREFGEYNPREKPDRDFSVEKWS
jgi:hypothetical protein